jgi:hypothetical protein
VYVVVTTGNASGFCIVEFVSVLAGVQRYEYGPTPPATTASSCALAPGAIDPGLAVATTVSGTPTVTLTCPSPKSAGVEYKKPTGTFVNMPMPADAQISRVTVPRLRVV